LYYIIADVLQRQLVSKATFMWLTR